MTIKFIDTTRANTGINPAAVVTAVVGGQTFLFVGNGTSSDISVFRVGAGGTLATVGTFAGPAAISFMTLATSSTGQTCLIVTGFGGESMAAFNIDSTGSLVSLPGSPIGLGFQPNSVTSVVAGGQSYVFAGTDVTDTVRGFRFDVSGSLVALGGGAPASATALASAVVGGTPYLFAAGKDNDGVSVFAVGADGSLTPKPGVVDSASLELDGASCMTTAVVGGTTFLFVGAAEDDGISAFRVGADGSLANVHNVADTATLKLGDIVSLTTATIGGKTFLFGAGQADDGVSAFAIGADGRLTNVGNVADGGFRELDGSNGVAGAVVGGATYLFATGLLDHGVSGFRLEDNSGNDTYVVDSPADIVDETGGGGIDLVRSSISFNLSDAVHARGAIENLTLTGSAAISGTGNTLNNVITGNAAVNVLNGVTGSDRLAGGLGNDVYVTDGGDVIVEALNQGTDTVQSRATYTLAANLERLVLTGNAAIKGTGNALANLLDASQNTAANGLSGLQGNDTYVVGAGDIVVEIVAGAAGGIDTVQSRVTRALSANVENLILLNFTTALNGTGNTLNNQLTGNNFNNVLSAAAGNDVLRGGLGNDTLIGGAGNDVFVFNTPLNASTNRDVVSDFANASGNNDVFYLDNAVMTKLAAGLLLPASFRIGAAPLDANDFIIYNQATGGLFYDANGNGAGAGVQFAVLSNRPALTASDFVVI